MSSPLRAAVVGVGALGRHHVRLLGALDGVELVAVHDVDPAAAERVLGEIALEVEIAPRLDDLFGRVDLAVVAAPTVEHEPIGRRLLAAGAHVMVEKPIAGSLAEADRLIAAAEEAGRVLAVGHVEFFNPAVQALLDACRGPGYIEVERLGAFSPRSLDIDVVLDLMIHDLQILQALDPSPVVEVRAVGINVLSPRVDIANVRIELASGCVATLTASRVSADKVRKLRVFMPDRGYLSLDYQEQEIKGYRVERAGTAVKVERADVAVDRGEPLRRELEAFVAACRGEPARLVTGHDGRRALATALDIVAALERRSGRSQRAAAGEEGA